MVDDANDFERGFGIEALRRLIGTLSRQFLKHGGVVSLPVLWLGGSPLLRRRADKHPFNPKY
jgi:hypothetical protein